MWNRPNSLNPAPQADGRDVLLVSKDRGSSIVLRAVLEAMGSRVRHAADSDHALAQVENDGIAPNWLIVDRSTTTAHRNDLVRIVRVLEPAARIVRMSDSHDIDAILDQIEDRC